MANTNELYALLGKKLKSFRNKMHWPIEKMAKDLGVAVHQIQKWEGGANKIPASLVYKVAKLLDIPINSFFEFEKKLTEGKAYELDTLLVTNDLNYESLIRKALKDFPKELNIYSIHDGQQALTFFKDINNKVVTQLPKPGLVLLDLNLTNVKGLDVLKNLKKNDTLKDTPVITMVDDNQTTEDVQSSYHLQASGVIHKSFSYDDLKDQCYKTFGYWADTVTLPR